LPTLGGAGVRARGFTWKEWASTLGDEFRTAAERGEPDDGSHYYHHWLAALERLITVKDLTDRAAIDARNEAWAEAYRGTPHGKPVELAFTSGFGRVHPHRRSDGIRMFVLPGGPSVSEWLESVNQFSEIMAP
jgi:nitrile hydratase accessory protein